jgi:hypothetical protein
LRESVWAEQAARAARKRKEEEFDCCSCDVVFMITASKRLSTKFS